jgi:hypothetical protein
MASSVSACPTAATTRLAPHRSELERLVATFVVGQMGHELGDGRTAWSTSAAWRASSVIALRPDHPTVAAAGLSAGMVRSVGR